MRFAKRSLTVIAASLILVLAGAGCQSSKSNSTSNANTNTNLPSSQAANDNVTGIISTRDIGNDDIDDEVKVEIRNSDTKVESSGKKPNSSSNSAKSVAAMSYEEAIKKFGRSGYRYQFANCSALPGRFTVKQGVEFMLDNRDEKSHILKIGSKTYTIPAYNYAIVSVSKSGTYIITCDGGGSGEIIVQS